MIGIVYGSVLRKSRKRISPQITLRWTATVRACQIYPSSCAASRIIGGWGRRRRGWRVGRRLDVADQRFADFCLNLFEDPGRERPNVHECCARFLWTYGTSFSCVVVTARPTSAASFFSELFFSSHTREVKERRPQDGRCESPTAEECAPMCGWEVWLGM